MPDDRRLRTLARAVQSPGGEMRVPQGTSRVRRASADLADRASSMLESFKTKAVMANPPRLPGLIDPDKPVAETMPTCP